MLSHDSAGGYARSGPFFQGMFRAHVRRSAMTWNWPPPFAILLASGVCANWMAAGCGSLKSADDRAAPLEAGSADASNPAEGDADADDAGSVPVMDSGSTDTTVSAESEASAADSPVSDVLSSPTDAGTGVACMTEYGGLVGFSSPQSLITVPRRQSWFTELGADQIGQMTAGGKLLNEFLVPTSGCEPQGIAVGPDGNLWFTEVAGNKIGRITSSGQVSEFPIPTQNAKAFGIAPGPDGNLWSTNMAPTASARLPFTASSPNSSASPPEPNRKPSWPGQTATCGSRRTGPVPSAK